MMNPFYGENGRRAILPEIQQMILTKTGCLPLEGFTRMVSPGDALSGSERVSGFTENHIHQEWKAGLSSPAGMIWESEVVPATDAKQIAFVLSIAFGNGSPLPQSSGSWDILVNDRLAVRIRNVNHSQLWRYGECRLAFSANRIETAEPYHKMDLGSLIQEESLACFGPAMLCIPTTWLQPGEPARISLRPTNPVNSTRWFMLVRQDAVILYSNIAWLLDALQEKHRYQVDGMTVYFGDIHTHSGQVLEECNNTGCGRGSRRDNYEFAQFPGGLDFYALTDHEWQIDPQKMDDYLNLADEYTEDHRFVCLPAYENTNLLYGHRNVYFKHSGGKILNANTQWGPPTLNPAICITPQDLWKAMEATGVPFITIPHHSSASSHPFTLEYFDPRYDRLFEVYSSWGSSEYYGDFPRGVSDRWRGIDLREALARNQRYGLMASSDGHDGHPGDNQSPLVKHHHIYHFCGSGRAAVFAPELTRTAVFDALYARRCYATTGVPILLDVKLNGQMMGSELPSLKAGNYPRLSVKVQGANGIDHIRIIKNGRYAHVEQCFNEFSYQLEWEDPTYRAEENAYYYVRVVQKDKEAAWSSPIWVG